MRFKKREPFFSVLLDTGINLLDSLRERVPDKMSDFSEKVRERTGKKSQGATGTHGE